MDKNIWWPGPPLADGHNLRWPPSRSMLAAHPSSDRLPELCPRGQNLLVRFAPRTATGSLLQPDTHGVPLADKRLQLPSLLGRALGGRGQMIVLCWQLVILAGQRGQLAPQAVTLLTGHIFSI